MSGTGAEAIEDRLAALEQQVKELRRRVTALEQSVSRKPEHPVDDTLTRQKVRYDWQA